MPDICCRKYLVLLEKKLFSKQNKNNNKNKKDTKKKNIFLKNIFQKWKKINFYSLFSKLLFKFF